MDTFAFIIHPIDPRRDISRKYPFLGRVATDWMIDRISPLWPPVYLSEIEGITSLDSGKQIKGWLVACPLSPHHFIHLPENQVYRKIIETGRLAERLGAKILGLGAYTSVVGDAGLTIARALEIPATTGDAYTVAVAVETVLETARLVEMSLQESTAAIVGATGAIGQASAELLANQVGELLLIGRRPEALEKIREHIKLHFPQANITISTELADLKNAHMILTVTNAIEAVIRLQDLQPGTVICDIARPRDVSVSGTPARDDILVIDGGVVEVPGEVDFHFDFGLPPGKAYACMAETFSLALEGRFEDYTLGREIDLARVEEIKHIANKHGFRLSGFRSFDVPVTQDKIEHIRKIVCKHSA